MGEFLSQMEPDDAAGLLAALLFLAFALIAGFVLGWLIYWDYRKKRMMHEERRLIIEKGMVPPPLPVFNVFAGVGAMTQAKLQFQQHQFEERRLMIEKGMVPPPGLFEAEKPAKPSDYFRHGAIMLGVGLGGGIGYFALDPSNELKELVGFVAPVVAMLGLGCMLYAFWAKERKQEEPASGKTSA